MVTINQTEAGAAEYIDAEIAPKIPVNGSIDRPADFLTRQGAAVMHALALEAAKK